VSRHVRSHHFHTDCGMQQAPDHQHTLDRRTFKHSNTARSSRGGQPTLTAIPACPVLLQTARAKCGCRRLRVQRSRSCFCSRASSVSSAQPRPFPRQYYSRAFQLKPARTWEDYSAGTVIPGTAMGRATSRGSEEPSLLDSLRNALKSCTI